MKPELQERPQLTLHGDSPCVLVVDDETLIRDLCVRVLDDFRVLQAGNGHEALEILRREQVDVVLSDIMMPDMDGLSLLKKAKEVDPTQVVVMMTGFADKDVVLRALRENADDFLTKPLNLLQLKTTLSKALDKKRLKEELVYLRRMDRLKNDFLGLVSHKLKTPVTSISLFLQNLENDQEALDDPNYRQHLHMVLEESCYLKGLINDLLHHSETLLSPQQGEVEHLAMMSFLEGLGGEFTSLAATRNVTLATEIPPDLPVLEFDRHALSAALAALFDNALKFSSTEDTITFSVSSTQEELLICFCDQGQGIPEEEIPKVFEKFYQIDPEGTGQIRGFGLGLYFARQFAHYHHGTLSLENLPSGGILACLTLPLKTPSIT